MVDEDGRFARHHALDGMGKAGQSKLNTSRALIVGLGGLGSPAAQYLAAAGVSLTLCDFGRIDEPDLQRQVLYRPEDVGRSKAVVAARSLQSLTDVRTEERPFDAKMLDHHDIVLDCTDEAATHAHVHAATLQAGLPLVWAALEGWEGQGALIDPAGPCLRCMWPQPADGPRCADVGIAGPVAGIMGTWQAHTAIKRLVMRPQAGVIHLFDGRNDTWQQVPIPRRSDCTCCARTI